MKKMFQFWCGLVIALYFYARMDILIWQRIFEANELIDFGIGIYHWGWFHGLVGFMLLGALLFYPHVRRMIAFPLSLAILAFSGLEDMLYYWLDGRAIPAELPWLEPNPLILKPVTDTNLMVSALLWLLAVAAFDILCEYFERRSTPKAAIDQLRVYLDALLIRLAPGEIIKFFRWCLQGFNDIRQ
jgi:hypothetical protein